jgi:hypothetical protein
VNTSRASVVAKRGEEEEKDEEEEEAEFIMCTQDKIISFPSVDAKEQTI